MNKKSNRFLVSLTGAVLALGSWGLSHNVDFSMSQEAMATSPTALVKVDCTKPTITSFAGGMTSTVTWAAPVATAASTPSATAVLAGAVDGESNPASVVATLSPTGKGGFVLLTTQNPQQKMAGLNCNALSTVEVDAYGDGADNLSFDIALQHIGDASNVYTAANKVDALLVGTKAVVFGATGALISTTGIVDGTDADGLTNPDGEVVIGSGTEALKGGTSIRQVIDVTNYSPASATDQETLTYVHTAT